MCGMYVCMLLCLIIVIGFDETAYELPERAESHSLAVRVLQGSLSQNLTLTVVSTPITAGIYIIIHDIHYCRD